MKRETRNGFFHDHAHALDFDRRAGKSDIRAKLGEHLIDALELKGSEWVLDIATGTGRFAKPVSEHLKAGKVIGLDQAMAMLSVARDMARREYLTCYHQAAGDAEALPFRSEIFDRGFVAFSLHHFGQPALMIREARRLLKPGGMLTILDPVVMQAQDSLDRSLNNLINQVFGRFHGGIFHFQSAEEIQKLLEREQFTVTRGDVHSFSFDQDGMDGIPTGRHWLDVAEELEKQPAEMKQRFEENYFHYWKNNDQTHVKGRFCCALICGQKM